MIPGLQVVTNYFDKVGLQEPLNELGFNLVGYGCTTCIGSSEPPSAEIFETINDSDLAVCAILSGSRNLEGCISPDAKMSHLAPPPLAVTYTLAGLMDFDFETEPLRQDRAGKDAFLRGVWPDPTGVQRTINDTINRGMYLQDHVNVFTGDERR